jgi:hypothetical protein
MVISICACSDSMDGPTRMTPCGSPPNSAPTKRQSATAWMTSDFRAHPQRPIELANALGISGTPAYVIGDEVVSGALGESVLSTKVANVRECGSTVC